MILFILGDNNKGRTSQEEKVGYKMPVCSRDPEWLGVICGAQEPGDMGGAWIKMHSWSTPSSLDLLLLTYQS